MICCTRVATFKVIVRRTESLYGQTYSVISYRGRCCCTGSPHAFPICLRCLWLLVLRVLTQCNCTGPLWWDELREDRSPNGSLGNLLCSSPLQFYFRMAAASVWHWMRFISIYWGAIAAPRRRFCIHTFGAFPMQVATTALQTTRGLLAVGPDMAELLSVEAPRKASLSSA
jgi:hypothetical protein